jgi:hypothetical protein
MPVEIYEGLVVVQRQTIAIRAIESKHAADKGRHEL